MKIDKIIIEEITTINNLHNNMFLILNISINCENIVDIPTI